MANRRAVPEPEAAVAVDGTGQDQDSRVERAEGTERSEGPEAKRVSAGIATATGSQRATMVPYTLSSPSTA